MTTAEFIEYLGRSELITVEQLDEIRGEAHRLGWMDADAEAFAQQLVGLKVITNFHAERLLRGKWRNFVINEKYRVLDRWDAGDLGIFFRCAHLTLRKNVTLRSHAVFSSTGDDAERQELLDRIRELAQIHDPHLGRIIDIEGVNGQPLLVMEDLVGPSLEELVQTKGPLPVEQAASYCVQAALGLNSLHDAGWLHGDARPARMVFSPQRGLKLLDASLADWFGNPRHGSRSKSRGGERGFPLWDYIAPEVHARSATLDGRADLYSLGCTLHHLLAGQPPFASFSSSDKPRAHQFAEPPKLGQIRKDVPAGLQKLIAALLAKRPEQRPPSGAAVAKALLPWARDHLPPVTQAVLGLASFSTDVPPDVEEWRATNPAQETKKPTARRERSQAPGKNKKQLIINVVAATLVIAAIGALLAVLFSGGEPKLSERTAAIRKVVNEGKLDEAADMIVQSLQRAKAKEDAAEQAALLTFVEQLKRDDLVRVVGNRISGFAQLDFLIADIDFRNRSWLPAINRLNTILTADPANVQARDRLAQCYIWEANWGEAIKHHEEVLKLRENEAAIWARHALLLARNGRWPQYREHMGKMWAKFKDTRNPADLVQIGLASFVDRQKPFPEYAELLPKLESASERLPRQGWPQFAVAATLYRLGRFKDALPKLRDGLEENQTWSSRQMSWPLLAMCEFRTGNRTEAHEELAKADQWQQETRAKIGRYPFIPINPAWWDWVAFDITLREAQTVLSSDAALR